MSADTVTITITDEKGGTLVVTLKGAINEDEVTGSISIIKVEVEGVGSCTITGGDFDLVRKEEAVCIMADGCNCCTDHGGLGCTVEPIQTCVCDGDAFCCEVAWDAKCVSEVFSFDCGLCPKVVELCGNGILDRGEECDDGNTMDGDGCSADCLLEGPDCGVGCDCCSTGHGVGCNDTTIQDCVCAEDDFCCNTDWDDICVEEVESLLCGDCI